LFLDIFQNEYTLTKEAVEAVLTGNITSHTHSQYLTNITKAMVESVLTGVIYTHQHDISSITNGVSQSDLTNHASDSSHLTSEQLIFLNNLITTGGGLTTDQIEILNLLSVSSGDLVISSDLIVEGSITAYDLGNPNIVNYDMLDNWLDYLPTMTNWVVSAPLIYDIYTTVNGILVTLDSKVDKTTSIIAGLGLSGGGNLSSDVTLNLDINNLTTDIIGLTDYIAFYRSGNHYNSLVSNLPFVQSTRNIFTPLYTNPNSTKGGGLSGGGSLNNDLYLELDINSLDTYLGTPESGLDYIAVYDNSTTLIKKLALENIPISIS
jgi:hypothetical protein